MKKWIISVIVVVIVAGVSFAGVKAYKAMTTPDKVHYHAGLVVFENNKKLDFSGNKYMYIKPCSAKGEEIEGENDEQLEKAHLHDNVGDLVHVELGGAIWKDLFTNIKFPIDYSKVIGYVNGKKVENFQDQPIRNFDSLVVFIGKNDTRLLSQAVKKEYIEAEAKKSKTCGE